MSLLASIKEWCVRESATLLVQPVGDAYVRPAYEPRVADGDNCYVRIKLTQMVLAYDRTWFKDRQPSVHSLVKLRYADQVIDVPNVLAANPTSYAPGVSVFANATLLPLTPFRGGEIDLELALVAIPGDDRLANGIKALANVAGLIGTPLSTALTIAGKVKESAEMLTGAGSQVHLAYRNTFNTDDNAAHLKSGYLVVANTTPDAFGNMALVVDNSELKLWDGIQTRPVVGVDYMVVHFEVLTKRDDLASFSDISSLRNAAMTAYIKATTTEAKQDAERAYLAMLVAIGAHPELIDSDRNRLSATLQAEFAKYRNPPAEITRGGTSSPPNRMRWSEFIDALPADADHRSWDLSKFK